MDVLVLGGTSFVGRGVVEDLLRRGHTPTLFNRGRTGAELFPDVERLVGDRERGDYTALQGRRWDAVMELLWLRPAPRRRGSRSVGRPLGALPFISTGQVYDHSIATDPITENSARVPPCRDSEQVDDDSYGPLKAACEDDLRSLFGERATFVRPGWVVGPNGSQ